MKRVKHKALLIISVISVLIAMGSSIPLVLSNNRLAAVKDEVKESKKISITYSNKIENLQTELGKLQKTYELQQVMKEQVTQVLSQYIEKRYTYRGLESNNVINITNSVKDICDESYVTYLAELLKQTKNVGMGNMDGNVIAKTQHTGKLVEVYCGDIYNSEPPDDYNSDEYDKSKYKFKPQKLISGFAKILINDEINYCSYTLVYDKDRWKIYSESLKGTYREFYEQEVISRAEQ